jgi:uncharacterized membrane protein
MADDYPTELTVGETGELIICIVNHEYASVTYQLEVKLNGTDIGEESIDLVHNETWEEPFAFKAMEEGEDQKLELLLYREGIDAAYRSLHLWVDVRSSKGDNRNYNPP